MAEDPTYGDGLLALSEVMSRTLGFLVISRRLAPIEATKIITTSADSLEKAGHPLAAKVVRDAFSGALNGEWEQMAQLASNTSDTGSA